MQIHDPARHEQPMPSPTVIDVIAAEPDSTLPIPAPLGPINMLVVCGCFVLSGIAALIYQTAWTRQFALAFGTSELAVAAVLAAYMGGLACGAAIIERCMHRISRALHWYAALELGIALSAVTLVPFGLWLTDPTLVALFGHQATPPDSAHSTTTLFYLAAAFLVLLVPTTLMGATLPLLARYAVRTETQIGQRIGLLYACNTAGAVGGALLGALLLLSRFGLHTTLWMAAAINVLVALLAIALALTARKDAAAVSQLSLASVTNTTKFIAAAAPVWVLPLMLLSGAVSFLHEVLWTRMLSHLLGSSIHAFGIMLASFLTGIALGGGLGAWLARCRESAARWLAASELAAALAAAGAWYVLTHVIVSDADTLNARMLFSFLLLFPLAFAIGLTYPLAVRVLATTVNDAAPASARVYSWNTVGAIVGAIAGGFFIIPSLRYEGAVRLAVSASCVLAVGAVFVLFRPHKRFAIPLVALSLLVIAVFAPQPPEGLLRYSSLKVSPLGELVYYGVGRSAAVTALREDQQIMIRTNGLPEAAVDLMGTPPAAYVEAWMAPLTVLARPQTRNMLVVGLGGGRVLEAVPPSVSNVDVIELESKVIDANRAIGDRRARNPLTDPRINLIVNDARGALTLTSKRYDAIVSQPSHPWTAGASHLYTREFMQQARAHLNPGGVFSQWMNIEFLDEALLRSLVATLSDVFPYVRVYRPAPETLIFLASDRPLEAEHQLSASRTAFANAAVHYGQLGLNVVEDLLLDLAMDNDNARRFGADSPPITDDMNRFAVSSLFDVGRHLNVAAVSKLLADYDPLQRASSFVYRELGDQLAFDYIINRLSDRIRLDSEISHRLINIATALHRDDLQIYLQSLELQRFGQATEAQALLTRSLREHPENPLLQNAFLAAWMSELAGGKAPAEVVALAAQLHGDAAPVLQAGQHAARTEWQAVSQLDATLAHIPWTSILNRQAAQLRVEWRVHVPDPELRNQLRDESIQLVDRLNAAAPTAQLFALRAASTAGANRPQMMLESINQFAVSALQAVGADPNSRTEMHIHLISMQPLFRQLKNDPRIDRHRYEEVGVKLEQLMQAVS
jgi:spermidine synthase